MFLITTSDRRFWSNQDKCVFLGEWCRKYSDREFWKPLGDSIIPYHWDDREKFSRDYYYINNLSDKVLLQLTEALNSIHNVSYSVRFWRIILGSWLTSFIGVLWDRFESVRVASETGQVTATLIPEWNTEFPTPSTYMSYIQWVIRDEYNLNLYKKCLELLGTFDIKAIPVSVDFSEKSVFQIKRKLSRFVIDQFYNYYNQIFSLKSCNIPIISNFRFPDLLKLSLELKQLPFLYRPTQAKIFEKNNFIRSPLQLKIGNSQFEKLLESMLPDHLPTTYLEGFNSTINESEKHFPSSPKVILTEDLHSNESLKFWIASKTEKGTKCIVAQHGGHYGTDKFNTFEDHEIKTSDQYASWGWGTGNSKKILNISGARLVTTSEILKPKSNGKILWILNTDPRYSFRMYSAPISSQWLTYFNDQIKFFTSLTEEVSKQLTLRLFPIDFGWNEHLILKMLEPKISVQRPAQSVVKQINESKLVVITYNATTYLETFAANYPTLLFWNKNHWEIREESRPYFEKLENVGIFHSTPESAASKLIEIQRDPIRWWFSDSVQEARKEFCRRYAYYSSSWKKEWSELLKSTSTNHEHTKADTSNY